MYDIVIYYFFYYLFNSGFVMFVHFRSSSLIGLMKNITCLADLRQSPRKCQNDAWL